jgi:hypothetical protein
MGDAQRASVEYPSQSIQQGGKVRVSRRNRPDDKNKGGEDMTNEQKFRFPGADAIRAMRSVYCALDMLHDDVCTPHSRLPKAAGMAMTEAKDNKEIKDEIDKYVEWLIVLSEEYRGMTIRLMRAISKSVDMPFESDVPVEAALDSRTCFQERMKTAEGETGPIEQMLDFLRTAIEKEEEGKT